MSSYQEGTSVGTLASNTHTLIGKVSSNMPTLLGKVTPCTKRLVGSLVPRAVTLTGKASASVYVLVGRVNLRTSKLVGTVNIPKNITGYPEYTGAYSVIPTQSRQVLNTQDTVVYRDIVVEAIPNNYGLITYDGISLTVS